MWLLGQGVDPGTICWVRPREPWMLNRARIQPDPTVFVAMAADLYEAAAAAEDPDGAGPRLFFQRVPEGKTAKNRVHLDLRAAPGLQGEERMAALEAECERLVALGATRVERREPAPPMDAGHIVMTDPEGNEFCLD